MLSELAGPYTKEEETQMSSTATVCTIIICRTIMQRWAEVEREKAQPYANSERRLRESVANTYHRQLHENRPVRRAYAE
jgi:hypothetical protein